MRSLLSFETQLIVYDREQLVSGKHVLYEYLSKQGTMLDDLDELGDIMGDMLSRQKEIEVCIILSSLNHNTQHFFYLG